MQYKLKHRLSAALMAGAMCCTMIPAASADEIATPETADTAVPEVTDSAAPDISQITENLYNDLPDAPTGSYLGSMGLPVATGETKISISAWVSDLYDGADAHIDADALNEDETTITIGKNLDAAAGGSCSSTMTFCGCSAGVCAGCTDSRTTVLGFSTTSAVTCSGTGISSAMMASSGSALTGSCGAVFTVSGCFCTGSATSTFVCTGLASAVFT